MNKTRCPTNSASGAASDHSSANASTAPPTPIVQDGAKKKNKTDAKSLWLTVFKCFQCGKHGHNLPKCRQCSQAYYCNADCQQKHWKNHKPVCRAAVAALARHAHRQRVARAVREKGSVDEGAKREKEVQADKLCVICQDKPVNPVEVSQLNRQDVIIDFFLLMEEYHGHNSERTSHV